ncbi:MAG: M50 family metallopeptidase [Leptolyngbyaceae cyanobacterium]
MFTNFHFDLISLLYTVVSLNVLWRLKHNWVAFWDDVVTPDDRNLADGIAVFLLIPIGVFFHELGHAIATWQMGGTVLEFQWRIFWGYVVPGGDFTLPQWWWIAFSGNLVSIVLGAIAIPLFQRVNLAILKEMLRTFARVELIYSLVLYPLFSFVGERGDWLIIYDFRAQPYAQITLGLHVLLLIGLWRVNRWLNQPLHPPEASPSAELLQQSPARFYRKKVRFGLSVSHPNLPPASPTEAKLEPYLDALYQQQCQKLEQHTQRKASSALIETYSFSVFVIASGLLAFGRLEMVPDILNNMPKTGNVRRLALVIPALLPLPDTIDLLTHPQAALDWLNHHRDQLTWDETMEKFTLKSPNQENNHEI